MYINNKFPLNLKTTIETGKVYSSDKLFDICYNTSSNAYYVLPPIRMKNFSALESFLKDLFPDYTKIYPAPLVARCVFKDTQDELDVYSHFGDQIVYNSASNPQTFFSTIPNGIPDGFTTTPINTFIYQNIEAGVIGITSDSNNEILHENYAPILNSPEYYSNINEYTMIFRNIKITNNLPQEDWDNTSSKYSYFKALFNSHASNPNPPRNIIVENCTITPLKKWSEYDEYISKSSLPLKTFLPTLTGIEENSREQGISVTYRGNHIQSHLKSNYYYLFCFYRLNKIDNLVFEDNTLELYLTKSEDYHYFMSQGQYLENAIISIQNNTLLCPSEATLEALYIEGAKIAVYPQITSYNNNQYTFASAIVDFSFYDVASSIIGGFSIWASNYTKIVPPKITAKFLHDDMQVILTNMLKDVTCIEAIDFTNKFNEEYIKNYVDMESAFQNIGFDFTGFHITCLNDGKCYKMFYNSNLDELADQVKIEMLCENGNYVEISYMCYFGGSAKYFNNLDINIKNIGAHNNFTSSILEELDFSTFGSNIAKIADGVLTNMVEVGPNTKKIFIPADMLMQDGSIDEDTLATKTMFILKSVTDYDKFIIYTDADYHYSRETKQYTGTMPSKWYKTFHSIDESSEERFTIIGNTQHSEVEKQDYTYEYQSLELSFEDTNSLSYIFNDMNNSIGVYTSTSISNVGDLQNKLQGNEELIAYNYSRVADSISITSDSVIYEFNYSLICLNSRNPVAVCLSNRSNPYDRKVYLIQFEDNTPTLEPPTYPTITPDDSDSSRGGGSSGGSSSGGSSGSSSVYFPTISDGEVTEESKTELSELDCQTLYANLQYYLSQLAYLNYLSVVDEEDVDEDGNVIYNSDGTPSTHKAIFQGYCNVKHEEANYAVVGMSAVYVNSDTGKILYVVDSNGYSDDYGENQANKSYAQDQLQQLIDQGVELEKALAQVKSMMQTQYDAIKEAYDNAKCNITSDDNEYLFSWNKEETSTDSETLTENTETLNLVFSSSSVTYDILWGVIGNPSHIHYNGDISFCYVYTSGNCYMFESQALAANWLLGYHKYSSGNFLFKKACGNPDRE